MEVVCEEAISFWIHHGGFRLERGQGLVDELREGAKVQRRVLWVALNLVVVRKLEEL